jgi:spore maturation protein CgeB
MPDIDILFIKQRIRRGIAIESSIEDQLQQALDARPGVNLQCYELGDHIRLAEDRVAFAGAQAVQRARYEQTETCLQYIQQHGCRNIFILNGYLLQHFNPQFFARLRPLVDRIAAWQLDDPYYVDMILPFLEQLDVVFSVDTVTLPLYQRYGRTAEWLPLACDPAVHRSIPNLDPKYIIDVSFIGVPFKGSQRVRTIDAIAPMLAEYNCKLIGATGHDRWGTALVNGRLLAPHIVDEFISIDEASHYYNGAAINLNLHKDSYGHMWDRNAHRLPAQSPCERTFAIAGCGGFQIIDATRPDLGRLFKPGEEITVFASTHELEDRIRHFLHHEDERRQMAAALQQDVHRNHTYANRVDRIIEVAFAD